MNTLWERFQSFYCRHEGLGFSLDISRMRFADDFPSKMEPLAQKAFVQMKALEAGEVVNPDENRMVGHYWLRSAEKAPTPALQAEINGTYRAIQEFAARIFEQGKFTDVL